MSLLSDPDAKAVDFSTYELVYDEAGKVFIAVLINAAERGVGIRGIIGNKITGSSLHEFYWSESNDRKTGKAFYQKASM